MIIIAPFLSNICIGIFMLISHTLRNRIKRSIPSASSRGTRVKSDSGSYFGNLNDRNSSFLVIPFHLRSVGVPNVRKIRCNSSSTVEPGNKGRPLAISKKIQPTPHMSIDVLYSVEPRSTSGGLYHKVTTSLE